MHGPQMEFGGPKWPKLNPVCSQVPQLWASVEALSAAADLHFGVCMQRRVPANPPAALLCRLSFFLPLFLAIRPRCLPCLPPAPE